MSSKIKAWLHAFRLRTLPLAFSSIITGSALAWKTAPEQFNPTVLILCLVTTLLLQILSNLANDYGDSQKGTDNEDRIGPLRAIQSGALSFAEMRVGIYITLLLALCAGIWLIVEALKGLPVGYGIFFFALGLGAIAAAVKYTMGKNPYGYMGLGDVFVLLFFGWVGVCGSYYLQAHQLPAIMLLPATGIGLWAATVLHLNNMRDQTSDAKAGKHTLAVKMGFATSKLYFHLLSLGGANCMLFYYAATDISMVKNVLLFAGFAPFAFSSWKVQNITDPAGFDPLLKVNALATFAFALIVAALSVWG